jgi:DNA-binding MarR family transcriptional regulator
MPRKKVADSGNASTEIRAADVFASSIGYNLMELFSVYDRILQSRTGSPLHVLNITQFRSLAAIRFNPGQTQQAVARHVGIDPSSMTPVINLLESRGWVVRRQSPLNRSAYALHVTAKGLSAFRRVEKEVKAVDDIVGEILGATARREFAELMHRLERQLYEKLPTAKPASRRRS